MKSKFIVFLLFSFSLCFVFGQSYPFKYDSLVSIENQEFIVYHKKESGIFNMQQGKFTTPMSSAHLQYLENALAIYKIEKQTISEFPFTVVLPFTSTKSIDKINFDYALGNMYMDGLACINDRLIIVNQFMKPIQSDDPLKDAYGEDSMTIDGAYVYPLDYAGVEKSGVFDISSKKWIVLPTYTRIVQVGRYLLGSKILNKEGRYPTTDEFCYFDLYENDGKQIKFIRRESYKDDNNNNWSVLLKQALQADKVDRLHQDYNYYKISKSGKETLLKFSNNFVIEFDFLLGNTWFDLIDMNVGQQEILAYSEGKIHHYTFNAESNNFELLESADNYASIQLMEGSTYFVTKKDEFQGNVILSLEVLENRIIVQHHFPEYNSDFPIVNQYGDDSVSTDGLYVYPPREPGHYKSGVYDLSLKKWIIPQQFLRIFPVHTNYIAQNFNLDQEGLIQNKKLSQSVFDKNGKLILDSETAQFLNKDEFAKKCLSGFNPQYSNMQRLPFELSMSAIFTNISQNLVYSFVKDSKLQLVQFNFSAGNEVNQVELVADCFGEFIDCQFDFDWHSMQDFRHILVLNGNELSLSFAPNHDRIAIPGNGKILFNANEFTVELYALNYSYYGSSQAVFYLASVQHKDLKSKISQIKYYALRRVGDFPEFSTIAEPEFKRLIESDEFLKHTYTRTNDILLVQKTPTYMDSEPIFSSYFEEDALSINFGGVISGNSGVYKKTANIWIRTSDLFAELKSTGYGYIGLGNSFYQNLYTDQIYGSMPRTIIDSLDSILVNVNPSAQLLDKQFIPYKYKDSIRFYKIVEYEFGYQIYLTEKTSILISPSGHIITEEHYEVFDLIDGQIIGTCEAIYVFDDFGDFVYDANGNPKLEQPEKRKVFEVVK